MTFGQSNVNALFSAIESSALRLGVFDRVGLHEPENTPGQGLSCSVILENIAATPAASGMAAVSVTITFQARLWSSLHQRPLDAVDQNLLTAVSALLGALAGGFTLGGIVRDVNVLAVRAQAGYVDNEGQPMRVIDVSIPVVANDLWSEIA